MALLEAAKIKAGKADGREGVPNALFEDEAPYGKEDKEDVERKQGRAGKGQKAPGSAEEGILREVALPNEAPSFPHKDRGEAFDEEAAQAIETLRKSLRRYLKKYIPISALVGARMPEGASFASNEVPKVFGKKVVVLATTTHIFDSHAVIPSGQIHFTSIIGWDILSRQRGEKLTHFFLIENAPVIRKGLTLPVPTHNTPLVYRMVWERRT